MATQTSRRATGTTSARCHRSNAGIGLTEVMATVMTLAAGFAAIDTVPQAVEPSQAPARGSRYEAFALAQGQMTVMKALPYCEIRATPGFVKAGWIDRRGHEIGDVHVRIEDTTNGRLVSDETYAVSWNVRPRAGAQGLMDVTLRVSWADESRDGAMLHVDVEGWRVR